MLCDDPYVSFQGRSNPIIKQTRAVPTIAGIIIVTCGSAIIHQITPANEPVIAPNKIALQALCDINWPNSPTITPKNAPAQTAAIAWRAVNPKNHSSTMPKKAPAIEPKHIRRRISFKFNEPFLIKLLSSFMRFHAQWRRMSREDAGKCELAQKGPHRSRLHRT